MTHWQTRPAIFIVLTWTLQLLWALPQSPVNAGTPAGSSIAFSSPNRTPNPASASFSEAPQQQQTRKARGLTCFQKRTTENYLPTSIDGCKPTLKAMKTFEPYRKLQRFKEWVEPKKPFVPPFRFTDERSDCDVYVMATSPFIEDVFSWEQIRGTVLDILEDCREHGMGGITDIGAGIGWMVSVEGRQRSVEEAGGS